MRTNGVPRPIGPEPLPVRSVEITLTVSHMVVAVRPEPAFQGELWLVDAFQFRTRLLPAPGRDGADPLLVARVLRTPGAVLLQDPASGATGALGMPGRLPETLAALRLLPGFLVGTVRALPLLLRWLRTRELSLRTAIRDVLGLTDDGLPREIDRRFFPAGRPELCPGQRAEPLGQTPAAVTIILPVYNSFELLAEAIDRVEAHTDLPWHLIVIEDASTDDRVRPWLRGRLQAMPAGAATLLENPQNLGFIGSVNRGLALALQRQGPVILLNSDAFVPEGWASRLLAPLLSQPAIASATPMSNDAELMTVPAMCAPQPFRAGEADALDRIARKFAFPDAAADVPTGVGFCMAMSPGWLARVPEFDPVFGRGYGEEVDWCLKVTALGGRHVGVPGLFVEHRGGSSFGSAEKARLTTRNNRLIERRHPQFPGAVQAFLTQDPLASPRLALAMAWAARRSPGAVPLYVAHAMGGGAEIWLNRRIARDREAADGPGVAFVLRLGLAFRWRMEVHIAGDAPQWADSDDIGLMAELLSDVPSLRMIYCCAVGDADPASLPDALLGLLRPDDTLEVLFHDYFPISPSHTLLNSAGRFTGVPDPQDADPAHQFRRRDGSIVPLAQWRAAWGRLVERACELTVFSQDSAGHVASAWPALAERIRVRPHRLHTQVPLLPPPGQGEPFAVAVLGNIGFPKGISVVIALARALARIPDAPALVVIGNTDPAFPMPAGVKVHGTYELEDLPALARLYRVGAWLVPSIWPETFSYTTHEALATGLPVIGFDLGAQGQAIREHPNGRLVPMQASETLVEDLVRTIMTLKRREPA